MACPFCGHRHDVATCPVMRPREGFASVRSVMRRLFWRAMESDADKAGIAELWAEGQALLDRLEVEVCPEGRPTKTSKKGQDAG